MATIREMFYLVDAGQGRWVIKHQVTDLLAGTLARTPAGLVLQDPDAKQLGRFGTFDDALRELYATA